MGDGRAEGLSAIGDEGQAAISLMPDVDGTGSGSLLDSILSTLLKKNDPVMSGQVMSTIFSPCSTLSIIFTFFPLLSLGAS